MHRMLILLLLLTAHPVLGTDTGVTVYQLSGAAHCLERAGMPPEKAADLLRAQGVAVLQAERRLLPLEGDRVCGAPTGEANVLTVAAADWTAFVNQHPDAAGYGLWVFDTPSLEVYKYDGTLQCGLGQEVPLAEMAAELEAAGIRVEASRKARDGLAHIAVCGAATGAINAYTIPRDALAGARQLGFRLLVTRELTEQIKPRMTRETAAQQTPAADSDDPPALPVPLLW